MTTVSVGTPSAQAAQRSPPRPAANGDPLPPQARAKLIALAGAATDARDGAQSATVRYADLKQLDYRTMQPEKAAGVEVEMNRLLQVRAQQNRRHSELAALVATIEHWLRTAPNVHLEMAKPAVPKLLKDETLVQALSRVRDQITALRQHLRTVQSAPLPKRDLKAEAKTYIEGLAQLGRPKISGNGSKLSLVFPDSGNNYGPMTIAGVAQMQAWLHGDLMIEAIEREIDGLPEPPLALSVKEKTKRLAELRGNLDTLERQEEALVAQAIDAGQDVLRRVDASPLAVLGLQFRTKVERVRLAK